MNRRDQPPEYIEIAVTYEHHTDKAILCNDGARAVWIPRSLIQMERDIRELTPGDTLTIEVQEWFAEKEGLLI